MTLRNILLVAGSLFMLNSYGQIQGNAGNGEKVYKKKCVTCHGKKGEGKKSQKAPRLAGQHDWYLYEQLVATQKGTRVNAKMYPFVKGLSDQELKDLAVYISSAFPWQK